MVVRELGSVSIVLLTVCVSYNPCVDFPQLGGPLSISSIVGEVAVLFSLLFVSCNRLLQ